MAMVGMVRQELLSGVRTEADFEGLRQRLEPFEDESLSAPDFEEAARCHNRCRSKGVAGSAVDFLICSVALRRDLAVLTTDKDFTRYARQLPLRLHKPRAR